jgi:hypothetical protein
MSDAPRSRTFPKLTFVVWQFVRVMVQLEKVGMRSQAYRAWRDQWQKLDRRLTRLGQSDRAAYSRLMMEEEVVIDKVTAAEAAEVRHALDTVIRQINTEIQAGQADDDVLGGLEFELTELAALRDDVRKLAPPSRNRPRRLRTAR